MTTWSLIVYEFIKPFEIYLFSFILRSYIFSPFSDCIPEITYFVIYLRILCFDPQKFIK